MSRANACSCMAHPPHSRAYMALSGSRGQHHQPTQPTTATAPTEPNRMNHPSQPPQPPPHLYMALSGSHRWNMPLRPGVWPRGREMPKARSSEETMVWRSALLQQRQQQQRRRRRVEGHHQRCGPGAACSMLHAAWWSGWRKLHPPPFCSITILSMMQLGSPCTYVWACPRAD